MHTDSHEASKPYLPWMLTGLLSVVLIVISLLSRPQTPLAYSSQKAELLADMNIELLRAIEAEKNAVLGLTVADSKNFAAEALRATQELDQHQQKLEAIPEQENTPQEQELIQAFALCWQQFKALDKQLLGLATQNSNLRAQQLSVTAASQAAQNFESHLGKLIQSPSSTANVQSAGQQALIAALKILSLHQPHIQAAQDQQMERLEKQIRAYNSQARHQLKSLAGLIPASARPELTSAERAYAQFMRSTAEILRLSRQNSNLKSVELSLGKKRLLSAQCQQSLASLLKLAQDKEFKATR